MQNENRIEWVEVISIHFIFQKSSRPVGGLNFKVMVLDTSSPFPSHNLDFSKSKKGLEQYIFRQLNLYI